MTGVGHRSTMIRMSEMQSEVIPVITLGHRLQIALDHADVGVAEIADEMGAARNTVSRWLHDKGPVRDVYLKQWALKCGVSYGWLKNGTYPDIIQQYGVGNEDRDLPVISHSPLSSPCVAA